MKKQAKYPNQLGAILGATALGVLPGIGDYFRYKADENKLYPSEKQRRKRNIIIKSILGGLGGSVLGNLLYHSTGALHDFINSNSKNEGRNGTKLLPPYINNR